MLGFPDPVSPYLFAVTDTQGRTLTITFPYDDAATGGGTGLINGPVVVHRDPGCAYTKVLVDVGTDGGPDTSTKTINVAGLTGDRTFTTTQVNHVGVTTIADVKTHITCAP